MRFCERVYPFAKTMGIPFPMFARVFPFIITMSATGLCLADNAATPTAAPAPGPDWLVNPAPYKAVVRENPSRGELALDNGIARRVFRLAPNLATVSMRLAAGDELVRATGPEARVTIDGIEYAIGGLHGQPVVNFLKDSWPGTLHADPAAYRFAGWSEAPISARLTWKKRPEWLSRDLPWPAPGREVALRFSPPLAAATAEGATLLDDTFSGPLANTWKTRVSAKHPRSAFCNEGKTGEIYTPADTAVYADRAWPAETRCIEVSLDTGDDTTSNAWGPGLALLNNGTPLLHIALRPNQQVFEVNGKFLGKFDRALAQRLRVRLEPGRALVEAAEAAGKFRPLATLPLTTTPDTLRVGKCGRGGAGEDAPDTNPTLVRCHISRVTLRGEPPVSAPKPRTDLPDITVHYALYDGIPLLEKWITVRNGSDKPLRIDRTVVEELRVIEEESSVEEPTPLSETQHRMHVETNYTTCSQDSAGANRGTVAWLPDADYRTQVNYALKTRCLLRVAPEQGPAVSLARGDTFESIRCFELLQDTRERERSTLARRRFYRTVAPWSQESPVMVHLISSDPAKVRAMIDQAAEVGVEMVILSFGSGVNMEDPAPEYRAKFKALADYAKTKGVSLGAYSLLASRGAADPKDNCGGPGAKIKFGVAPCLATAWGADYLKKLSGFLDNTGFGLLEHDGSYAADTCGRTHHPGHRGLDDSRWAQWRAITAFYKDCRAKGVYLNVPDWYFLNGSNKIAMGYRETNWSLPRAEQEIIERQNIHDGTWEKTPSMGWMFVPLTQYQGGGAAATIEPLHEHLDHYEARLANLFGAGVQACYRGPRIYDTDATKAVVKKWISYYKTHRRILDADIIHLRRPDGRDWDGLLHVDPQGDEKALAFLYNPLETAITRDIALPLHYAGLAATAAVSLNEGVPLRMPLDADRTLRLRATIPARGHLRVLVKE